MRATVIAGLSALAVVSSSAVAVEQKVTPIQKVLQMMQEMVAKGKQEKQDEESRFNAFDSWCSSTRKEKTRLIGQEKSQIEALSADIASAESDISSATTVMANLETDVSAWTHNKKAAAGVRALEKADFQALHADYSESIDAIARATNVLRQQSFDRKQATSLLQAVAALARVPADAKRVISSFVTMQQPDESSFLAAPEANAYEFQSGGVVEMLEKLRHKFTAELRTAEKEEMNTRHSWSMVDQDLTADIENANEEIAEKTQEKNRREQELAKAQGELADTQTELTADSKYLSDLLVECASKAQNYESRQQLRAEEIEALGEAIKIISSPDVMASGKKHLPQLVQTSFVEVAASVHSPKREQLVKMLQAKARTLKSKALAMIAVKAAEDPFKEVKKMIQDMIVKLMEEANAEASHKGWCDTELATNKVTREEKTSAVEKLQAQIEQLNSSIEQLSTDISDLSAAVSELNKNMAVATEQRTNEKAKNAETVKEAADAQEAVAKALQVLKDYYARASTATALVQGPADDAPETFDKSYQGQQGSSTGVVGMLEVIQSDFARLETETKSSEEEAQNAFEEFMQDSKTDVAVKSKSIQLKEGEKQQATDALAAADSDRSANQEQLDAALAYLEKLRPSCLDSGLSYEERVQSRKEEVESLQEALSMLSGEF